MVDWVVNGLIVAGVLSMIAMPLAVWSLVGVSATCRRLEQRNAAQAVTIGEMEEMLRERGGVPVVRPGEGGGAELDWRWAAQDRSEG